jgi:hypothetical protein
MRYLKKWYLTVCRVSAQTKFGVCVGPQTLAKGEWMFPKVMAQLCAGTPIFPFPECSSHPWTLAQWIKLLTIKGGWWLLCPFLCIARRVVCRLPPLSFHAPLQGKKKGGGAGPKVWGRGKTWENPTDSSELLLVYAFDHWIYLFMIWSCPLVHTFTSLATLLPMGLWLMLL